MEEARKNRFGLDDTADLALEALAEAHDMKKWALAVELGDAWTQARGDMPALAAVFYAQALMGVGRYRDAHRWARSAANVIPDSAGIAAVQAHSCYAQALARVGDFKGARQALTRMIYTPCAHAEAIEKQGHVLLATKPDKWKQGWAMHETRLDGKAIPPGSHLWDGTTKEEVAVLHEQGLGDAVLFARWLPWVERTTGVKPRWYGPKLLHRWIEGLGYEIGGTEDSEVAGKAVIYAMSLPHMAKCSSPLRLPEPIAPVSLYAERNMRRLNLSRGSDSVRVGVCWQGAARGWHDFERSFTAEQFLPILKPAAGIEFVNLAHDADPGPLPLERVCFGDVYATGQEIASCDFVVTVDTSIVHIAGSLAVPTFAIVPTVMDWRYEWPYGKGTPFYRSVAVCRRKHGADVTPIAVARSMVERFAKAIAA